MNPNCRRGLTAAQQHFDLRACELCRGEGSVRAGQLTWTYDVAPTALSRLYTVRIEQRQGDHPKTFVVSPDLVALGDGRRLPHVYAQKPPELCLFYPKHREWDASQLISRTIVPWTSVWLFYFEEWLFSDDWKGGGIHPTGGTRSARANSRRHQQPRPPTHE